MVMAIRNTDALHVESLIPQIASHGREGSALDVPNSADIAKTNCSICWKESQTIQITGPSGCPDPADLNRMAN